MTDLSGDHCDPLLVMETVVQDFSIFSSDPLQVELEKVRKAEYAGSESVIKMEELEEVEEKVDSCDYLMNSSLQFETFHRLSLSVQEDPLNVKEEEEELLEAMIEEDRLSQNISGPTFKNVRHTLNFPRGTSQPPIKNLGKSMFNPADTVKISQHIRSQKMTWSTQGDPLDLDIEEEEGELKKVNEDCAYKNFLGPAFQYVQNRQFVLKRPSCLLKQNSLKSMYNQADQMVPALSTTRFKKSVTPGALHVAKLRSPELPRPKVVLVTKSQPKPLNMKRGTSLLKSDSGNSMQPSLNIYAAAAPLKYKFSKNARNQMMKEELLRQKKNLSEKVLRDELTKNMNMLREKLAQIWDMDNASFASVLEMARDYCVFLQQQETQLMMDQHLEKVKNSCLKRRLETMTCSQTPMPVPVEKVPWEGKIKIENVYSTVGRFK